MSFESTTPKQKAEFQRLLDKFINLGGEFKSYDKKGWFFTKPYFYFSINGKYLEVAVRDLTYKSSMATMIKFLKRKTGE